MLDEKDIEKNYTTKIKLYPAMFGARQADNNIPMCESCVEYIAALYGDEKFKKEFRLDTPEQVNSKTLNQLYGEQAYKRYREGYEWQTRELKEQNDAMLQEQFKEYQFNNTENITKYIRAVKDILYHANNNTIEQSVIKLTSWAQWFRQGLKQDKTLPIDSSALFFYSAMGGTGKSELLKAFSRACEAIGLTAGFTTATDICARFTPDAITESNVLVIEEMQFISSSNDINLARVNAIIDRSKISYEQKLKNTKTIDTNLSIIGATNNRYTNRRYSIIIINEEEIDLQKHKPPSPERLKQAWLDLVHYCPDPRVKFISVKTQNQKNPFPVSDISKKIYDVVNDDSDYAEKGARSLINALTKNNPSDRQEKNILRELHQLIERGICEKVDYKGKKQGLQVSKIRFDLEKFRQYLDVEMSSAQAVKLVDVESVIVKHYLQDVNLSDGEIKRIESNIKKYEDILASADNIKDKKTRDKIEIQASLKLMQYKDKLENAKSFMDVLEHFKKSDDPPDSV